MAPAFGVLVRLFGTRLAGRLALLGRAGVTAADKSGTAARLVSLRGDRTANALSSRERRAVAKKLAMHLVEYIKEWVRTNRGRNPVKSPFTRLIQRSPTTVPLVNTGDFLNYLQAFPTISGYIVGWAPGEVANGMNAVELMRLHEHGFEVDMEAHPKVRRWVAYQMRKAGVRPRPGPRRPKRFLRVPARPFYDAAISSFQSRFGAIPGAKIIRVGTRVHISVT